MDRADVGVVQGGRGLGLALKTGECLRIEGDFLRQELEGDKAMKPRVFSFVHNAHTAATELLDDAVVRDGLTDHWRRMLRLGIGQVNETLGFWSASAGLLT